MATVRQRGKGWQVKFIGPDGRHASRTFDREAHARQWARERETEKKIRHTWSSERVTLAEPGEDVVYVIGSDGPLVKIGHSRDMARRLDELQAGSPVPLVVLLQVPGGRSLETALHRVFVRLRVYGEWFYFGVDPNPVGTIEDAISDLAEKLP